MARLGGIMKKQFTNLILEVFKEEDNKSVPGMTTYLMGYKKDEMLKIFKRRDWIPDDITDWKAYYQLKSRVHRILEELNQEGKIEKDNSRIPAKNRLGFSVPHVVYHLKKV